MAQLPSDSYRPLSSPAFEAEAAPLRFGADTRDADAAVEYRAPRSSRLRVLRGPLLLTLACGALIAATWLAWGAVMDAVAAGAVLGFVVSWPRSTRPRRAVRLSDDRGRMAVDDIAGQLRASILELDEIRDAEVRVENRGGSRVRVRAWLRVSSEARIDDVLDEVDAAADWLVHHRLGLLLSEPPLADVKYDELDLRTTRPSAYSNGGGRSRRMSDDEDA
jgi:hypothetical protein